MNRVTIFKNLTISITKAGLRDYKSLLLTLGLPIFMLFAFWITTRDGSHESQELILGMIPAITALAVMMGGQTQATRLVKWKEEGALKRLALAPFPIGLSVAGVSISQVVLSIIRGVIVGIIGILMTGLSLHLNMLIYSFMVMSIVAVTFVALGTLLSSIMKKSYLTAYVYFGIFMPMFFIGSFPREALPKIVGDFIHYLPTTMGISLVHTLFEQEQPAKMESFFIAGLLIYSALFLILGSVIYRRRIND